MAVVDSNGSKPSGVSSTHIDEPMISVIHKCTVTVEFRVQVGQRLGAKTRQTQLL